MAAPSLGARLGERLWFRLPTTTTARRDATGDAAPTIRELLAAPFEVSLRGRTVRGWSWGDGGPVAYLVHGWGGSLEQLTPFVAPLLDRGLTVVAFDGLSHGRSDAGAHGPGSSDAVELGRALDAVAARFGPARVVVAHSMGALSAVLAVRDGWLATERLVLVAPPAAISTLLGWFGRRLGMGPRTSRRLAGRAERRTGYAVDDLDVATIGRHLAEQGERPALLVVHDLLDREADHATSAALVRGWPGAQLLTTAGLGHRRILSDAAVTGAAARFAARLSIEPTLHGDDRPTPLAGAAARPESDSTAAGRSRVA